LARQASTAAAAVARLAASVIWRLMEWSCSA
jgi:hypothetical protein